MKKILIIAMIAIAGLSLIGCAGQSSMKTATSGNISFEYPDGWTAESADADELQVLDIAPSDAVVVFPSDAPEATQFVAASGIESEYTFADMKSEMESAVNDAGSSYELVKLNGTDAIRAELEGGAQTTVIIIPDSNGDITSFFLATYDNTESEESIKAYKSVIDSVTVK